MLDNKFYTDSEASPSTYGNIGLAVADNKITPILVANAYGILSSTGNNVKVGIISLGGGFQQSDLQSTFNDLYTNGQISNNTAPTITTVLVDGATNNWTANIATADTENTLDLYCVAPLVPQANIVLYIGQNSTSGFANVINRAVDENCDVISISWAGTELLSKAATMEPVFAKAASKGITVCVSSGDTGSMNLSGYVGPMYPASSANVLAVGGTTLVLNTDGSIRSETRALPSGGGISAIIPRPSWQNGLTYQTATYFSGNSQTVIGAPTALPMRGVPDISAPYYNYAMRFNGQVVVVNGTSASCPVMAGMVARYISLNGRRPPVGTTTVSTNPIFYSNTSAYYDYSSGDDLSNLTTGYAVTTGWDPVVGLGRPYGNKVYQQFTSAGTTVKTATNTWAYVANVRVKTATNTWSNVRAIWTKTVTGWQQTF